MCRRCLEKEDSLTREEADVDDREEDSEHSFSLRVGNTLFKQLDGHIFLLRRKEEKPITKQAWIEAAVQEKLEREKNHSSITKEKRLQFKLSKDILKAILSNINFCKKLRKSYSKRQWLLEAVEERLLREEQEVWRWLNSIDTEESKS